MDSVLWGFEKQEITIVCVMDLSAAFDTVDHNLLETTLQRRYGIHEAALEWIDSYLRPRGYRVVVNDAKSSHKDTPFSVPQGSCLGPYLYLAYASTLEDIIEDSQVKITGFADDHALRKTCKPTEQDQECTVRCLEHNLSKIKKWMDAMKLCMNTSKTEIIVFGSGVQLQKVSFDQLSVAGDDVLRTSCIKYLGVHMDGELKLHKHITEKCKIASYNLYSIRCIRETLMVDACKQVVQLLVISHLDYCNSIFMGMPEKEIN